MLKKAVFLILALLPALLWAQQDSSPAKFALVIGNGAYANLNHLDNPPNDANDVAAALESLGFTVDRVIDGTLDQMDSAVMRLKNRLSVSKNTYGFFFYAGHGVQSNGENYLIPVNANIPGEGFIKDRALSVQSMLNEINDAGNSLNIVVLDACRDNPFSWSRGGSRGLAVLDYQPSDSIIVYATSAGKTASDGTGRNGLFTSQLLPNLTTPGLEVKAVFERTGANVAEVSHKQQIPAVYNQFFGTAYLGSAPDSADGAAGATGSLKIATVTSGIVQINGAGVNQSAVLAAWATLPVENINTGSYHVVMNYEDGKTEEKIVNVGPADTVMVEFLYHPTPLPSPGLSSGQQKPAADPARLNTIGASVGSALADPQLVGTVRATIAPRRNLFIEPGVDIGLLSGASDASYYHVNPYVHAAYYFPLTKSGIYAGAGAGYLTGQYKFPEGNKAVNSFVMDLVVGGNILSIIDVSYTFKTSFKNFGHKISAGYVYRFQ